MGKFELLLKEINGICKDNDVHVEHMREDLIFGYVFKFKKDNERIKMNISEWDIYNTPFRAILNEVEYVINKLLKR